MHRPPGKLGLQRLAGADLRARTIRNFREMLQQVQEIQRRTTMLKLFLEDEIQLCDEKAGSLDNIDSSYEK
jgi:hypothetical protein